MPWQIVMLGIDEIDGIGQNRATGEDGGSSGSGGGSVQTKVLSVAGGNQNTPNLFLFWSTNYKNMMDNAILRRLAMKFFIGLPSFDTRRRWLASYNKNYGWNLSDASIERGVMATVMFSSDNMRILFSKLRDALETHVARQAAVERDAAMPFETLNERIFKFCECKGKGEGMRQGMGRAWAGK